MRVLGNLVLPDNTQWTNQMTWSPVRRTTQRTTGGGIVVTHQRLKGGQPITLTFLEADFCLTFQDVEKIKAMAMQAGESFSFVWDSFVSAVVFDEQPHELKPCFNYFETEQDFFFGEIKLLGL